MPEFELQQYKGLEVEEETPQVAEADIDRAVEGVRNQAATFEDNPGQPAADGDMLTVNYQGYDVKAPATRLPEERDVTLELGGRGTRPAFNDNLRGALPGETREFDFTYPADYPQKTLAGKTF